MAQTIGNVIYWAMDFKNFIVLLGITFVLIRMIPLLRKYRKDRKNGGDPLFTLLRKRILNLDSEKIFFFSGFISTIYGIISLVHDCSMGARFEFFLLIEEFIARTAWGVMILSIVLTLMQIIAAFGVLRSGNLIASILFIPVGAGLSWVIGRYISYPVYRVIQGWLNSLIRGMDGFEIAGAETLFTRCGLIFGTVGACFMALEAGCTGNWGSNLLSAAIYAFIGAFAPTIFVPIVLILLLKPVFGLLGKVVEVHSDLLDVTMHFVDGYAAYELTMEFMKAHPFCVACLVANKYPSPDEM